jgi:hypothetical protein
MAIEIRSNKNIKGLEIQGIKTKVAMYADDSSFFLNPQSGSLRLSGLKSNSDKCTILSIGSLKNTVFTLPCSLPIK